MLCLMVENAITSMWVCEMERGEEGGFIQHHLLDFQCRHRVANSTLLVSIQNTHMGQRLRYMYPPC